MMNSILACGLASLLTLVPYGAQDQDDATPPPPSASGEVQPFPGIVAHPDEQRVELETKVCLEGGWLEQIACAPGSREHESLVVVRAKPSQVHAALLLVGFEPGSPGHWYIDEDERVKFKDPTGPKLAISFRYKNEEGEEVEVPARTWIRDHKGEKEFPETPWIFGGSEVKPNPEFMGPGEHYVADMTGSIVGLVTFGDEVIGFSRVIADQESVHAAEWELNTDTVPPPGTEVTLIIRPWKEPSDKPETGSDDDEA